MGTVLRFLQQTRNPNLVPPPAFCAKQSPQLATSRQIYYLSIPLNTHQATKENRMLLSNIEQIPGKTIIEHYGIVSGSTVRAKNVGRDFAASLKNIVGGELKGYTQLLGESRDQAIERMKQQAEELGANAIVNVRFSTSSIAQGASELFAYGTAVKVGE
jgi:uncharacterized protein YbjQ (UPF0145 family)